MGPGILGKDLAMTISSTLTPGASTIHLLVLQRPLRDPEWPLR